MPCQRSTSVCPSWSSARRLHLGVRVKTTRKVRVSVSLTNMLDTIRQMTVRIRHRLGWKTFLKIRMENIYGRGLMSYTVQAMLQILILFLEWVLMVRELREL